MVHTILRAIWHETERLADQVEQVRLPQRTIMQFNNNQIAIGRYFADRMPWLDSLVLCARQVVKAQQRAQNQDARPNETFNATSSHVVPHFQSAPCSPVTASR